MCRDILLLGSTLNQLIQRSHLAKFHVHRQNFTTWIEDRSQATSVGPPLWHRSKVHPVIATAHRKAPTASRNVQYLSSQMLQVRVWRRGGPPTLAGARRPRLIARSTPSMHTRCSRFLYSCSKQAGRLHSTRKLTPKFLLVQGRKLVCDADLVYESPDLDAGPWPHVSEGSSFSSAEARGTTEVQLPT